MNTRVFTITLLISSFALLAAFLSPSFTNIPEKAEDISPLLTGEKLPDLELLNNEGKKVSLKEMMAAKPTVLVVYRGGWCPYCNAQLKGLQEAMPKLKEMGYQVLAISPENAEKLSATAAKNSLDYSLLTDPGLKAAQAMGIVYQLDEETAAKYKKWNFTLLEFESGKYAMPVPTVMVLDKSGRIQFEYINPNYRVRLHPELLLKAAELAVKNQEKR